MNERVSILIPAYNAASWIEAALDSAVAQTHAACEIVVVDDGSQDETLEIARKFAQAHEAPIEVHAQSNAGASAARNHALRRARGEYIQFLDADDLLGPAKIERQLTRLREASIRTIASGEWARFTQRPDDARFNAQPNWQDLDGVEFQLLHYESGWMMQPAAWLCHRVLLDSIGPWNESLSLNDDGEYFNRVTLAAERILFCPGARVYYRSGVADSLSSQKSPQALGSLWDSTESNLERLLAATGMTTRARAAAAHGWKRVMFEAWPVSPAISFKAETRCNELGGSARPFPAGQRFNQAARLLGWRRAKRLRDWFNSQ